VTVGAAQERFLDEAVASVRSQTYRASDLVVVRWGAGAEHASIAAARNAALAAATGRYARLLEASDTLPWHSTARLVRALARSPHGTAAGRSTSGTGWRDRAFAPAPGSDPGLADRLVDVARWRSAGLAFAEDHGRFGDAVLAAADTVLGRAVLDEVTHEDRDRALGLPFGHLRRWAREADSWLAAVEAASSPTPGWAARVLDRRLPALLGDVESLSDAQWQRLVAVAERLWPQATADTVRAESRVLAWLVAHDRRDDVTRIVLERWRGPDDLPTVVADGRVLADLGAPVPPEAAELSERETPLVLRPQRRTPGELELVAFVRDVDTTEPPLVRVTASGRPLEATSRATPAATRVAGEAEHDHDHAWLVVSLPSSARAIEVELTVQGVTRRGRLAVPDPFEPAPTTDPRGDDEVGPRAQRLLQRWYAQHGAIEPDLAYFQAYTGQHPTDSPLAIHRALRRLRPDVRVRWLVDDPAVPVPEGAEPVLLRSRAWYETLATAHWLVTNIEPERWFRRKPGQELVQTFHGNPGKTMGLASWRRAGLTPGRIEQALDAGPRNWTLLVSPSPEMTGHYREQFAYDGPVMEHGYPRDDELVGPGAPAIRERARRALGIGEDQVAVLYAPTWRDEQATNYRAALLHDGFDVPAAAAALGERYVLLLRGHRFHRRGAMPAGARVVDVTAHPEVNELILAADAAVLDYSSIRFDIALTGRPMVFCVPDLDAYAGGRGFLYDFRESAPGPLLAGTAEVVAALRDLPALARQYADALATFNARFNAFQDGHASERVVEMVFGRSPWRDTSANQRPPDV
jgi:CDP-glycerol glycerophosphotransferase (TagB/SpsB family)